MSSNPVGFVGLGHLGGRMAVRLLEAGVELVVFDPDGEQTQKLADEHGAGVAGSPREVADQAEVVFSCLPSAETARDAVLGEDGVASAVKTGSGVVECSTVSPQTARELADGVRARGATAVDASVSGSTIPAEKGELVLLVGGDRELYERGEPLFAHLAKATYFMGDSGTGATAKLVVNTMLGVAMQGLAEAWALGIAAGLNRDDLAAVLSASDTVPVAHQPKVKNLAAGDYPAQFALRLMHKDFGLIDVLARECDAVMPVTAIAAQLNAAQNAKQREEDFSSVAALIQELSGQHQE